ncbi:hypothetical protein NA78x_005984 [Anatilimnocola sp. NA78]|uniref:hypothetical protein n=1 Tax=Anatilimnocola sp. NA78 TaxID=3415683 RepID=UPI003CE54499
MLKFLQGGGDLFEIAAAIFFAFVARSACSTISRGDLFSATAVASGHSIDGSVSIDGLAGSCRVTSST